MHHTNSQPLLGAKQVVSILSFSFGPSTTPHRLPAV